MQLNRLFVSVFLLLTVTACGYAPVTAPRRFNPATEPTLVPTSEAVAKPVYTIEQGLVTERLTFEARVSPRFESAVLAPLSGTILDLDVSEGDFVAAGDRLARYDFSPLEAEIAELQEEIAEKQALLDTEAAKLATDVERAQVELDIARLDLELAEQNAALEPTVDEAKQIELLGLKAILAQNDFDRLAATIDSDGALTAEIGELAGEIVALEEQMQVRTIVASADGTILALGIRAGVRISAEQSVAVIGNMGGPDDVAVSAVLRSDDLERLADGMQATLVFASDPETSHTAQIVRLPYPFNIGGNDLGFDPEDKALRILPDDLTLLDKVLPGEKVDVTIIVDQNQTALWLPAKAIREFNGRTFIVVREGEREQRIDVELGLRGDGQIEILGAVDVGQQVIGQ